MLKQDFGYGKESALAAAFLGQEYQENFTES